MMAEFDELLATLREPGEDGLPDSIYDDIAGAYGHAVETRDAKVSELDELNQAREAEISRLKSMNYDLMMASSSAESEGDTSPGPEDEEITGIDDLFA